MNFVCYNHQFYPADTPLLPLQNRAFKYGDGLFETMKVYKGRLLLASLHEERLFSGLAVLRMAAPITMELLTDRISELCRKNGIEEAARVRVAVFREEGSLASFAIEALPLSPDMQQWKDAGLAIDIFPYARKSTDAYSNLKTANFLPYVMAGLYAQEHSLDDSVVLNTENRLCDTSKANLFLSREGQLFTPSLEEGCVNGVMRRYLIESLKRLNIPVHQAALTETDLIEADEVFLTNSIIGLCWVRSFRQKLYQHQQTASIYQQVIRTIYLPDC